MKRGEVYYADLGVPFGSEQGGCRPVVVIQNDIGNKYSPTIIVAPVTTQRKNLLKTHVGVGGFNNLHYKSTALLEQVRTIDRARIGNFVCKLNDEIMDEIDRALRISLELSTKQEGGEKNLDEVKIFDNEELGLQIRTILNDDGSISVNAEDAAMGFGWCHAESKNGKVYRSVRWATINGYCREFGFANELAKDDYIPESLFYRLGMKASNEKANKFQNWLALEVIPEIRKTGGYQKKLTPEEMMRIQLGMIDDHESRIAKLENTMTINHGQQRALEDAVNKTVIGILGGRESCAYKEIGMKVFAECNRDLKNYFKINSRDDVPKARFDEAVEYAQNWKPCTNTAMAIDSHNTQMDFQEEA